jgi:hypothetical protein
MFSRYLGSETLLCLFWGKQKFHSVSPLNNHPSKWTNTTSHNVLFHSLFIRPYVLRFSNIYWYGELILK